MLTALQVAAFYEHDDAREYETLLSEATDPQLEDERLIQVPDQCQTPV
jgi:rubrerythrin